LTHNAVDDEIIHIYYLGSNTYNHSSS